MNDAIRVEAKADWPEYTVLAPGALKKAAIQGIPVTFEGRRVGTAELSEDGEIINAELASGELPKNLRDAFLVGLADSLSISVNYREAVPYSMEPIVTCICKTIKDVPVQCPVHGEKRPLTQEEKSQRWNQRTLPYGM